MCTHLCAKDRDHYIFNFDWFQWTSNHADQATSPLKLRTLDMSPIMEVPSPPADMLVWRSLYRVGLQHVIAAPYNCGSEGNSSGSAFWWENTFNYAQ